MTTPLTMADRAAALVRSQPLSVVVLGPGDGSPGHEKRQQILDHLRAMHPDDEVKTPEEMINESELFTRLADESGPNEAEEILVRTQADAIVALVVREIEVNGVLAELAQFLPHDELRNKTFVAMPRDIQRLLKKPTGYLLQAALKKLPPQQSFPYTPTQLDTCTAIRGRFDDWLLGVRAKKLRLRLPPS